MKFVRSRVLDPQTRGAAVFESKKEDAVVEPDENRYVTLVIRNCSVHTIRLEEDHILGCL